VRGGPSPLRAVVACGPPLCVLLTPRRRIGGAVPPIFSVRRADCRPHDRTAYASTAARKLSRITQRSRELADASFPFYRALTGFRIRDACRVRCPRILQPKPQISRNRSQPRTVDFDPCSHARPSNASRTRETKSMSPARDPPCYRGGRRARFVLNVVVLLGVVLEHSGVG